MAEKIKISAKTNNNPTGGASVLSKPKTIQKTLSPEDVRAMAFERLREYHEDPRSKSFTGLITGKSGSGKSFLMRTMPRPIHVDFFDPGGTVNLVDLIDRGEIVPDTRWDNEDEDHPHVYSAWKDEMEMRLANNYFDMFATYVIDSSTTWADCIMNWVLKRAGIPGQAPRWAHDYVPQKVEIHKWVKKLMGLPCNFIMTGHLEAEKDEVSGRIHYSYMTTGKGSVTIPLLFDEVWVMDPQEKSGDVEYRILTKSTKAYTCRSRLAKDGLLEMYEPANMRNILKKAKFTYEDKPLFKERNNE